MKPVNEMSVEEVRDEIAEAQGWKWHVIEVGPYIGDMAWRRHDGQWSREHPVEDSLDSAAACMPKGWFAHIQHWRHDGQWHGTAFKYDAESDSEGSQERVMRTVAFTERETRFRLALACIRSTK